MDQCQRRPGAVRARRCVQCRWQRLGIAGNAELFRLFINFLVKQGSLCGLHDIRLVVVHF
ncbi:hypothetical protein E6B08_22400 [Pseudomonas putida]|uniref:Uncharacterized protein n=1 Tax=Pseudomonas putida TaxID=303 RepID=A0A4D6XE66_PSEPU|nr:hypothetical protein E6B08_22400 [Pseudomonas putida]